jgi:putative MATE family efflux protein
MREKWNNRALVRLLWPLVAEQVLGVAVGMVDTVMMSAVGEYAVSGVSLVDAIATLLIIAFGALATGGSVVIGQYIGRGDAKRASAAAKQLIYISLIAALGIMAVALGGGRGLLRLIYGNIAPEVMGAARSYFLISALGYPALAVYNAAAALFRSMGNSRVTMKAALFMNLLHLGGNFILIHGLRWGVEGAALSTLVSRIAAAGILLGLLIQNRRQIISLAGLSKFRLEPYLVRGILKVGIPSGVESSMFQLGKILVSRIPTRFGTAAIAANAVTGVINSFSVTPCGAFGMALVTIVSQCVGARDYRSARFFTRRFLVLVHGAVTVLSGLTLVFIDPLISLFSLSVEAHDMTRHFLWILSVMNMVSWPLSFTLPNALRAAGDARYVMTVAIISMWLVRVLGAYICVFPLGFGVTGMWYAMVADWCVRAFFYTRRWIGGRWQDKQVI